MGFMGFGFFWMILLLLVPVVLFGYLLRGPERPSGRSQNGDRSAVEAARERYARGEIDRETYRRLIQDLEG